MCIRDRFKGVADVERIIGDAQTGAVTLDDRAAFGFALDADDVEVGPQSGGFEPHGTASGPDVPQLSLIHISMCIRDSP